MPIAIGGGRSARPHAAQVRRQHGVEQNRSPSEMWSAQAHGRNASGGPTDASWPGSIPESTMRSKRLTILAESSSATISIRSSAGELARSGGHAMRNRFMPSDWTPTTTAEPRR